MELEVKICGLSTPETLQAAIDAGANYVGFVFFEKSPRNVTVSLAAQLIKSVPKDVKTVGVFVDPTDDFLHSVLESLPLDIIQLHGHETPQRTAEIRELRPVIKAISVSNSEDIIRAKSYFNAADMMLFDAAPPKDFKTDLPGGNGISFDWGFVSNMECPLPWILSGGLDIHNIKAAITTGKPPIVDVSSGVESAQGIKSIPKIKAFIKAVKALSNPQEQG